MTVEIGYFILLTTKRVTSYQLITHALNRQTIYKYSITPYRTANRFRLRPGSATISRALIGRGFAAAVINSPRKTCLRLLLLPARLFSSASFPVLTSTTHLTSTSLLHLLFCSSDPYLLTMPKEAAKFAPGKLFVTPFAARDGPYCRRVGNMLSSCLIWCFTSLLLSLSLSLWLERLVISTAVFVLCCVLSHRLASSPPEKTASLEIKQLRL